MKSPKQYLQTSAHKQGRTSTPEKHIVVADINDINISEIDTPLPPLDGQENPDAIDYA